MTDFQAMFPDEREKGETVLRQSQLVMLRMLKIFDYLCVKHSIKYFMTGGSLIGVIRHQGFIPWDDDLDVGMTRKDYEKFIQLAVPELPNDIFFQNPSTDFYYPKNSNVDARLRDKYSSYTHVGRSNNKWHEGLQLDIFVYDQSYPPHNFWVISMNKMLIQLNNEKRRAKILKAIEKLGLPGFVYCSNFMQALGQLKTGTYVKKKELAQLQRARFEDMEVYIPAGYDAYLKRQYGDYMQLPPEEKRYGHSVKVNPFKPCDHTEILYWKAGA